MFKEIIGFSDFLINEYGIIKTKKGNIYKQTINKNGYYTVTLYKNGKRTHARVHRLVAITFIPNLLNKDEVNHIDGNKLNNHVSNLEWVSQIENIRLYFMNKEGRTIEKKKISLNRLREIIEGLPDDYPIKQLMYLL